MNSPIESMKIVLLGEAGVGKTSIISQFIEQQFQEDIQSSAGGTFSSKTCIYGNNQILKLEIWDTAGQERYRALTTMFYKEANAAILVYDITRQESYEQIQEYWVNQLKEAAPSDIILTICANKSDLINQEKIDEGLARDYAKEIGAMFCSTSAKNDYGISDLFLQIAKKYTGSDNIRFKDDNEDIPIAENTVQDEKKNNRGSVKLANDNNDNKVEKKKGCC